MNDLTKQLTIADEQAGNYITVKGSKMHYLEQGQGEPILFLHGMPLSSFLWRNIIPALSIYGRCIAPDLIGMGKSDKPNIDYRVFDHIAYMDDFIAALNLRDITLVMHGWGSVIGFDYARRHESNIKALAFFESHIRPTLTFESLSLPIQHVVSLFKRPGASYRAIVQQNYLINQLLPSGIIRPLDPEVFAEYQKPFKTPESRKPLWQYVRDLPLGGHHNHDVVELIGRYSEWLQHTPIPKLMLYAVPGFITPIESVHWAQEHLPNLQLEALENVLHCPQESEPELFRQKLLQWYVNTVMNHSVINT